MIKFEDLSIKEKMEIYDEVNFQNYLYEVADLEYEGYIRGIDPEKLYFKLMKKFSRRCK